MPFPAPRTRALARLGGYLDLNDEMDALPGAPSESEGIRSTQETPPPPEQQAMQISEPPNELETLKEHQRRAVFAADIGRAGAMAAEAISGAKAPMALYDRQEARAGEPLKEYMERLKINARAAHAAPKPGKPQKSTDPNSPESKRAQMLVKATLGDKFTDEEIAQITEADADNALKYGSLSGQREVSREGHVDANTRAREQRALQREQGGLKRGVQWAQIFQAADQFGASQELKLRLAEMAREEKEKDRDEKRSEKVDAQAKDFGTAYAGSGLPEFETYYAQAQDLFKRYPKSLPGVGMGAGRMPRRFTSADGKTLRSIFGQMMLAYKKSVTGLGSSEKEDEAIREATGLVETGDDESMRLGVEMLKKVMDAKANALEAGYKPEAVGAVKGRLTAPTTGAATTPKRTPAAQALPTDASGQPTLDGGATMPPLDQIPVAKVQPGQKLVDTMQDGEYRRVPIGGGKQRVVVKRGTKLRIVGDM